MRCGKRKPCRRLISLLLAFCMTVSLALGCTGCGGADGGTGIGVGGGASAASMFLRKTEGTVAVADAGGADIAPEENLNLYSGYTVGTREESYAWIDLDKVKLAKLDADSAMSITKDGKNLSIDVTSGSLFFNVTEPLKGDETMVIATSSILVGIRGTCGWVTQNSVALLEGTVTVTAGEESVTINAGERARLTEEGALEVSAFTYNAIPAFVAQEFLDDDALNQTVFEASGLRIPTTYEEFVDELKDVLYSEVIDFEADGSPELLVLTTQERDNRELDIFARIYRKTPDGIFEQLWTTGGMLNQGQDQGADTKISLAVSGGRLYLREYIEWRDDSVYEDWKNDLYWGSVAQKDGTKEDWGTIEALSYGGGTAIRAYRDERGLYAEAPQGYDMYTSIAEIEAIQANYREEKILVVVSAEGAITVLPDPADTSVSFEG